MTPLCFDREIQEKIELFSSETSRIESFNLKEKSIAVLSDKTSRGSQLEVPFYRLTPNQVTNNKVGGHAMWAHFSNLRK